MNRYSPQQAAVVDQDNRNMATGAQGVSPMSSEINSIWLAIDAGTIGITSQAADIDSLALGGGTFTQDLATAPANSSLLFAWLASRFHNGKQNVAVGAGSLALAASSTNYIEVTRAGVVSSNTTGFTVGRLPLWIVVTGASSWTPNNVTSAKPLLTLIGANGVDGSMLSTAGQTKELTAQLGAIAATATFLVMAPNVAATLIGAFFTESVAVAANDTNYWTLAITNLGQTNVGTNAMLNTGAVNTTKATGGAALASNQPRSLTLHGVPGVDTNMNTNPNDVLQITITGTGSPTALAQAMMRLDFQFQT